VVPRGGFLTRRPDGGELPDPEEATLLARRVERAIQRIEEMAHTTPEWPDGEIEPQPGETAHIAEEPDPQREAPEQPAQVAPEATDLSGWWELTNQIESTSYNAYHGLRLGYRIFLKQEGGRITGRGQKWSENGKGIPSSRQTPISLAGTIDGASVQLRFTEHGAQRRSGGSFHWQLSADQTSLQGSFSSSAASTSGSSVARRIP